jgi:hypothetical protein
MFNCPVVHLNIIKTKLTDMPANFRYLRKECPQNELFGICSKIVK